uniref:Uncharacterized protein n=1 Tax=Nymphaea colorata TaxID=210225 RepID=A0A5K1G3V5_9MAGN
MHYLLVQRA